MTEHTTEEPVPTAILIGVYREKEEEKTCYEHVDELEQLAETFGCDIVDKVYCHVRKYDAGTLIGSGKIEEVHEKVAESKITYVIFDHDISPAQQRNLEKAFGCTVLDRTELIHGVFGQRARSREARLQVELAEIRYEGTTPQKIMDPPRAPSRYWVEREST